MNNWFRMIPAFGRWALALLATLVIFGSLAIFTFRTEKPKRDETVGIVLPSTADDSGWSGSHYLGMKRACDEFGVKLLVLENVSTEGCSEAIEALIADGAKMVFLCGNTYPAAARETIWQNPKITFATIAVGAEAPNLSVCFVRMHQGRYLAGVLAARRTKSGVLGYVAPMPKAPVVREINAFTLGARLVNPNARVVVCWSGVWADAEKETEAVRRLITETGADIVTYHQDDQAVPDACEELGVDYIGFNAWLPRRSEHYLGTVACRWDIYYRSIVQHFLKGELIAIKNRWIGMNEGAIDLADTPESIGLDTGYALAELRRQLESRHRLIFRGPIRDTSGRLRIGEGEVLRDDALIHRMDWFVEGVEFLGE